MKGISDIKNKIKQLINQPMSVHLANDGNEYCRCQSSGSEWMVCTVDNKSINKSIEG